MGMDVMFFVVMVVGDGYLKVVDLGVGVGVVGFVVVLCFFWVDVIFIECLLEMVVFVFKFLVFFENNYFVLCVRIIEVDVMLKGKVWVVVGFEDEVYDYVIMNLFFNVVVDCCMFDVLKVDVYVMMEGLFESWIRIVGVIFKFGGEFFLIVWLELIVEIIVVCG